MECSLNDEAADALIEGRAALSTQHYKSTLHSLIQKMDVACLSRLNDEQCDALDCDYDSYRLFKGDMNYKFMTE